MSSPFAEFPRRIFLDSSTLQTMLNYGEYLYDGGNIELTDRIHRDPEGMSKLEALRAMLELGDRAPFEFALSRNSFIEVRQAGRDSYLRWAYDVLDHWSICLAESGPPIPDQRALEALDSGAVGYLGEGDRALVRDALLFACDTFLTMENKLPRGRAHMRRVLGLRVETPAMVWERISPWARLFR